MKEITLKISFQPGQSRVEEYQCHVSGETYIESSSERATAIKIDAYSKKAETHYGYSIDEIIKLNKEVLSLLKDNSLDYVQDKEIQP